MNKTVIVLILLTLYTTNIVAQDHINGTIDDIRDFSTVVSVPMEMPDGVKLMTDVYLPIMSDSLMVEVDLAGLKVTLELIPKGTQLIIYDTLHNAPNPNPYQLPMVFTRTPYNKNGQSEVGNVINILGYAFAVQDMRGRYASEGVYFPMLSDSWDKSPYHPDFDHIADVTELDDPKNSNKHEDGYNSIQPLLEITREYDLDQDGTIDVTAPICNGSIGMFGASALGNTQYQAAAAHRIDPTKDGLKCLFPIVATNDHFTSTGYNNGVLRERIVTGWVRSQVYDLDDDLVAVDENVQDDVHTAADYNLADRFEVAEKCIDHFSSQRYGNSPASAYPNSGMRVEMDATLAPVDANGDGDANGQFSRYSNMEVPMYHLSGWWDIFVNGQIQTYNRIMENLSDEYGHKKLQKLIIGPYAHQTTGATKTGDMTYKANASDIIGVDLNDIDIDNIDVPSILSSEVIAWYRYNLNYKQGLGEPKVLIPESDKWQNLGLGQARVPAEDFIIKYEDLINFLAGVSDLPPVKADLIILGGSDTSRIEYKIPPIESLSEELGFNVSEPVTGIPFKEFEDVPNVRFYVVGPVDDGVPENENVGNYWFASDMFPLTEAEGINPTPMYLHGDGSFNFNEPYQEEATLSYTHDPNNPVLTVGGANMIVDKVGEDGTLSGGCCSQGQMNLANEQYATYTMENEGVLQFVSEPIADSVMIAGFPKAKIYASSTPEGAENGPTDTDFFVRILDVYPDGREFFVVEGAVNARAREYAKSIVQGEENINAPYSNINGGEVYEYEFELLPIAYVWGKDHKIKILISSSNYDRYQVNANLPMEDGDFFRRTPNDGQTYTYNGEEMSPRKAVQRIYSSPWYPSQIELPIYQQIFVDVKETIADNTDLAINIYPNPTKDQVHIFPSKSADYTLKVSNMLGQIIHEQSFNQRISIPVKNYPKGIYLFEINNQQQTKIEKVIVE